MVTAAELRRVGALADLGEAELGWLLEHGRLFEWSPGDVVARDGTPPEWMYVLLEGEIEFYWANSDNAVYVNRGGNILGALPFSRMARYNGTGRASQPTRALAVHRDRFPEMLRAIPALEPRLIAVMTDRVREITRLDLREEKLMSLGKLSAGLAHELNNPASAAHRAAAQLGPVLEALEDRALALAERAGVAALRALREAAQGLEPAPLGTLERGDREQELADWLQARGVPEAWDCAPALVEAGVSARWLEALAVVPEALSEAVGWLQAHLSARRLSRDVEAGAGRVSELVAAVKRYTHMDQSPKGPVDVRQGLEDALALFDHALKGVRVERDYGPDLPPVEGFASELNQVWTNLIENARDAMSGSGVLRVRAARQGDLVLVEIADTGPGIAPEIREKIYDPFFTTKEVGKGTGLGLDAVRRILHRHKASIRFDSQPGDTKFQVRLPIG